MTNPTPTQRETIPSSPPVAPRLGLWDAVSIIVGIVVGTSIFRASSTIFDNAGGPWRALALWILGGALAWCGAVCYAELATTYPRDGGDYEYLNRAFGRWCGFLFSWAQLATVISGNIAIMAYAFADYAGRLGPTWQHHALSLSIGSVAILSTLNALGIVAGKLTQNVLTAAKLFGLAAIVIAGILCNPAPPPTAIATSSIAPPSFGLALVFVLYAYGGWTHAAYVAAEVRNQRRNLPRALVFGILAVTLIYLAVNVAYLHTLGFDAARHADTPATDVLERAIGTSAGRMISLLVMLSALSAINGMILTGTRIYAVWGDDYPALRWLGVWNRRTAAPLAAIAVQAAVAIGLVLLVGTEIGRHAFDRALQTIRIDRIPWDTYHGGFNTLVIGSAPVYWTLTLLTACSVFILRRRHPDTARPFRIPFFPVPAVAFCITCSYLLEESARYAKWLSLIGIVPTAIAFIAWLAVRQNEN